MNDEWLMQFKSRMSDFSSESTDSKGTPISIKIRVNSGCYCPSCCPEAHKIINHEIGKTAKTEKFEYVKHESGPEILVFVRLAVAGINLSTGIINLITSIIKARSEGIKKGDRQNEPLELIVRGYNANKEYYEKTVLSIPNNFPIEPKAVEDAIRLALNNSQPQKQKKAKKKR